MEFLKRFGIFLAVAVFTVQLAGPAFAVSTNASCAILMDAESGRILYSQNIHEKRLIASITKLMTALVAVENCRDLKEEVTIKPEWLGIEGSSIYLKANEVITMEALLFGLLLQSGNDAAMAIACHVANDAESFAQLMNQKAGQLGMKHSHFANPSGLNAEDHYSTAYDMALLAKACLDNDAVSEICATRNITIGSRTFVNHNKLLFRCEGCVGMKTGYTELAGRTLVSAVTRNGQTLICVTLNDRDDWDDHEKLYDYGFGEFPTQTLCENGQFFGSAKVTGSLLPAVSVVADQTVRYPVGEDEVLEMTVGEYPILAAPVRAGTAVSCVIWSLNGQPVARANILTATDVLCSMIPQNHFLFSLKQWIAAKGAAP